MAYIVTLTVPEPLIKKAKELGINCSEQARKAIAAEIGRVEKERLKRSQSVNYSSKDGENAGTS